MLINDRIYVLFDIFNDNVTEKEVKFEVYDLEENDIFYCYKTHKKLEKTIFSCDLGVKCYSAILQPKKNETYDFRHLLPKDEVLYNDVGLIFESQLQKNKKNCS